MDLLDFLFGSEEERKKKKLTSQPQAQVYGPQPQQSFTFPVGTQAKPASPVLAPSFGTTPRSQPRNVLDLFADAPKGPLKTPTAVEEEARRLRANNASSQGSTVLSTKPVEPIKPIGKPDPSKDNFGELQGLIDDEILMRASVPEMAEAVIAKQREIAESVYTPVDEKSSWFRRFWEPTKQALKTPGDTLITQAQNIANYGLEPLGMTSRPLTSKGQLEAMDRFLEKYAPERLVESKMQRALAGEQSMPQGAAEFTTNIGTTAVAAVGAIGAFRSLPVAAKLKNAGQAGIYATHFMENLIASAVASVPTSVGRKKAEDFPKLMVTNGGFLFPTASYGGLAIATTASFLANMAMGQDGWEAAGNSLLGLAGAAAQRKDLLSDLQFYRRGTFGNALRGLSDATMDQKIPADIRNAAIDEAAQLRAYYEQKPQDLDGLYKMTMDAQKRMIKLYAEYKAPSPTGERRMIGLTGPTQNGPDGGFPQRPQGPDMDALAKQYGGEDNIPLSAIDADEAARVAAGGGLEQKVAPVDFTKPNKPDIEKMVQGFKTAGADVYEVEVPIGKIKGQGELLSDGLTAAPGDTLPPPVGFFNPETGQVEITDGNRRFGFFSANGYDSVPMIVVDPKHAMKDPGAIDALGFKRPGTSPAVEKQMTEKIGEVGRQVTDTIAEKLGGRVIGTNEAGHPTIEMPDGTQFRAGFMDYGEDGGGMILVDIEANPKGTGLGTKAMNALKEIADESGTPLHVAYVNNPEFFRKFPWLKETTAGRGFDYTPKTISQSAFPTLFRPGEKAPVPTSTPVAPRIASGKGADSRTWSEKLGDDGGDPNVVPRANTEGAGASAIPQGTKPVPLAEARRIAVDLYRQLDSEYNPEFTSKAEFGPEFADAELNAGLARELVTNPQIRGVLQQVTGKQGYSALEGLELDNMGPFVSKLRAAVPNGSQAGEAIASIQARIRDDVDGEYGRTVLNNLIAKSRGEVRAQPRRPNEDEILAVLDRAIEDGRLQMNDDLGGRTVEQIYEALYNEQAKKADAALNSNAGKLPSAGTIAPGPTNNNYANVKLAKNAARRAERLRLGDILRKEDAKKVIPAQGVRDAKAEASLSNREIDAIHQYDEQFSSQLEESRKLTQAEYNKTLAEARQLPPEVSQKIIADLERLKASGKIATPLEARLQKNKFLDKLLTQQKGKTRVAQRAAVAAKKDANHEKMKSLYKTLPRMPSNIQKMMKALHEGYRKSMPLAQQDEIVQQMKDLNEIGAQQNRLFKERRIAEDDKLAREIIKTAVRKVKNRDGRVRDRVKPLLMNETPPNLVIGDMGEGAFKIFKDSMDEGMNEAWPLQRDWDREVLEKAQELGIKYDDMQAIVDYSLWNRGGKAGELAQKRLMNMGVVDPRDPPTLTPKQQKFYEWQQKFLKVLAARTKEVHDKENPLRELDISDPNYFPMKVVGNDFTVSKGPNTMSIDQVPDGFTKSIKGNEALDIYREPDALFRHINDVAHYVTLTERMQQMRRLLERPDIIAALGNENVDYLQNRWLDLVARHGTYAEKVNEAMAMINAMGSRAYGGVLAGKAIVGIRQFGSVIDALGPLVKNFGVGPAVTYVLKIIKNTPALINEHLTNLAAYIETNPDLQASVGLTDLVMEQIKGGEFSSRHTFLERHPKVNKFIFAVIRQPDLLGRATLAMHAEGLYKAQGMEQKEAQRRAMQLVNNVFGSMRVHNRPTASGNPNTRPLYLFGQTQRARQGMFRQAMKDWPKDPVGNSAILGSYLLSSMILAYLGTLVIDDDDTRAKAQKQSIVWGWALAGIENTIPIMGSGISRTLQTGDASNALPYLGMLGNALSSFRQVFAGKKPETKWKGLWKGTEQTLGAAGIPAPALRSNYTLLQNIYKMFAGDGEASVLPDESQKELRQLQKDLQRELNSPELKEMQKQLRKELQNLK